VSEFNAELAKDMAQFYADPLGFVLYAFDWGHNDLEGWAGPDEWQRATLIKIRDAVRNRKPGDVVKVAVKTGKGPGKTAMESWLILWLMSTRPHFAGTATANTGGNQQALVPMDGHSVLPGRSQGHMGRRRPEVVGA
jgi:hypothetical protein